MLTIRGLETGYGKVLRGVDLTVPDGGIVALFGGTGKPTLLKCVSGLLPVRSGARPAVQRLARACAPAPR